MNQDQIERMRELLIDAMALLQHWVSGKADNWDGTTRGQARVTIREISKLLQEKDL